MKRTIRAIFALLLCFALFFTAIGCNFGEGGSQTTGEDGSTVSDDTGTTPPDDTPPTAIELRAREARRLGQQPNPNNTTREDELPTAPAGAVVKNGESIEMKSAEFTLCFIKGEGGYYLCAKNGEDEYYSKTPVLFTVHQQSTTEELALAYASAEITAYGCLLVATLKSANGSEFSVEDRYYYPEELTDGAINVRRTISVKERADGDEGFSSAFMFSTDEAADKMSFFVPHTVYNSFDAVGREGTFAETELGLPMVSMMTDSGFAISISRYQPVINHRKGFTASFDISETLGETQKPGMRVDYPSTKLETDYFYTISQRQIVLDLSISGGRCSDFNDMMVKLWNNHFMLQDQRIVDTDIDEVFDVICEDYKTFFITHTRFGRTSYGLPWRVTLEDGFIGAKSYQSGFVGQQVPAGYQMMFHGIKNNDPESLEKGLTLLNFWIDAGMMTPAGVPITWYNGVDNDFILYPIFLRMMVDTMEGYLGAYKLAKENGIECSSWEQALLDFSEFLVNAQNEDGSYYRCYNRDGGVFKDGDNGIADPGGNICQSDSKENTAMAVRFLAEMYKLTGDEDYKNAAIRAGEYVYENHYSRGYYIGGTCDNANVIDKEAGVFALYCYDSMYSLTQDEKWIEPMKQAAAFVMSMVQCFSFPAGHDSGLKAATPFKSSYNDGSSFITSEMDGIDNFAAVIYYHLFRLYVITGDPVYFYQAEFMQQNSKSTMNWDGELGYAYKSLVPEATTIDEFMFFSAGDDHGVMGVWLPWQSVANATPICNMLLTFGTADVADLAKTPVEELYQTLFPSK